MCRAILDANPTNNSTIHILDARPRRNAVANQAKGLGYEYRSEAQSQEMETHVRVREVTFRGRETSR